MSKQLIVPPKKIRAAETKATGTVYKALSDGFVKFVAGAVGSAGLTEIKGYTDGSNPPTTIEAYTTTRAPSELDPLELGFFVIKGNYWKVSVFGGGAQNIVVQWYPYK